MNIEKVLSLPEGYRKLRSMPDDPEDSQAYGMATGNAQCIVMAYPIPSDDAMDYADEAGLIRGIHHTLSPTQALIEVGSGKTPDDHHYIYSIIKNRKEPSGVSYFALLHIDYGKEALCLKAFFDEAGTTGIRDSVVFEMLSRQKSLDKQSLTEKWFMDPYDRSLKRSFLMNLSEQEQFDGCFPAHPLSQLRAMLKYIVTH